MPNNVSSNPHGNGNSIENDFDNDNGIGNCTVVLRSMMASQCGCCWQQEDLTPGNKAGFINLP